MCLSKYLILGAFLNKAVNNIFEISLPSLDTLSDEEIAISAQNGDDRACDYLLAKYKNFIRTKARSYFLIGADKEDIIQEGMIGLYKAIRDFRNDKQSSFRAFAELCVTRQIITAIKTATRQKHIPLNSYVSLNKPVYEDESEKTLIDIVTQSHIFNPEDIVIDQENLSVLEFKMSEMLSDLEMQVLNLYTGGKSYIEISEILGKPVKSVDNALQRIKSKLLAHLSKKN
jgi:RNA polymerase sporulation-specific sigma factor